ncbi:MAG: hypothetical protein WKF77_27090 [Planctomycetaceae bacterium]
MSGSLFRLKDLTLVGSDAPRLKTLTLQIPTGVTAVVGLSGLARHRSQRAGGI